MTLQMVSLHRCALELFLGGANGNAVGLSRVQSRERAPPRSDGLGEPRASDGNVPPKMSTAHDHEPFSEQELNLALQRTHLAVPSH